MSDAYLYDESQWPIVRVIPPNGSIGNAQFAAHLAQLTRFLERQEPIVFVIEWRVSSALSVEQRDKIRRHEAQHRSLVSRYQLGMAIVVHSAFQRAMITAVVWMVRSPSPTRVFSSFDEAFAWARSLLGPRLASNAR